MVPFVTGRAELFGANDEPQGVLIALVSPGAEVPGRPELAVQVDTEHSTAAGLTTDPGPQVRLGKAQVRRSPRELLPHWSATAIGVSFHPVSQLPQLPRYPGRLVAGESLPAEGPGPVGIPTLPSH